MAHIEHRFLDGSNLVTKQIDGHHGNGIVAAHVLGTAVLDAKVLAEAQRLRLHPCLLQFYENQALNAMFIPDGGTKVNAEH